LIEIHGSHVITACRGGNGANVSLPRAIPTVVLLLAIAVPQIVEAQTLNPSRTDSAVAPTVRSGRGVSDIRLDGILDESAWRGGEYIEALTMLEPIEGGHQSGSALYLRVERRTQHREPARR
jgi:hypothetical protein